MIKKIVISSINLITYLLLGLMLIFFGIQLFDKQNILGIAIWAGALLALLFLSFLIGYLLFRFVPDRRNGKFTVLYNIYEAVCIFIILIAAIELFNLMCARVSRIDQWQIIPLGKLLANSREIYFAEPAVSLTLLSRPGMYASVKLVSIISYIFDGNESVLGCLIFGLQVICAFASSRIARGISGRIAAVFTFALFMLLPSQICLGSVVNDYIFGATLLFLQIWLFTYLVHLSRIEVSLWVRHIVLVISAILMAAAVFALPAAIIVPFAEVVYICVVAEKRGEEHTDKRKTRVAESIIYTSCFAISLLGLWGYKAYDMALTMYDVLYGYGKAFLPNEHVMINMPLVWGNDSYMDAIMQFNTPFENQIAYGCLLGLAFISLFISWFLNEKDYMIIRCFLIMVCVCTFLNGASVLEHLVALPVLTILSGSLYAMIYSMLRLRKHESVATCRDDESDTQSMSSIEAEGNESEMVVTVESVMKKAEEAKEGVQSADKSSGDELEALEELEDISSQLDDAKEEVVLIDNPLPLPKRPEKQELEFDVDVDDDADWDV